MIRQLATAATVLLALGACSPKPAGPATSSSAAPTPASVAAVATPIINTLDCNSPIGETESAKALLAKYGKDAVIGELNGAEGATYKGLILYGNDPSRRLKISFWDDAMEHVSSVSLGEKATAWTGPGGLHLGSSVAEVEAANGKAFSIAGFGWDYGGFATDLKAGKLTGLKGGCSLQLRFDLVGSDQFPDGVTGDGVTLSSGDARFKTFKPVLTELAVGWPLPDGVKPSADDAGGD